MPKFTLDGSDFPIGLYRKGLESKLVRAALRATDRAATSARDDTRTAMVGARLGGLANAIKQTSDLKKKRIRGAIGGLWSASGVVYAHIRSDRTAGALEAYTQGATIVPKRGKWLAIATDQIPKRVGRFRMTPQRYREGGYEQSIGPLQFVRTSRATVAYLVAKRVSINPLKSGSARRLGKAPGRGRVEAGIVAFVLIKATSRSRRINVEQISAKWHRLLPGLVDEAFREQT